MSLFFLVRLVVVVTLQSSLSRPSVLCSYNQSRSNQEQVRCRSLVPRQRSSLVLLPRVVSSCSTAIAQSTSSSRLILPNTFRPIFSHYDEQACLRSLCLILPTFRATFVALPSSLDQSLVPTSSIPTSSHFIINRSAKAPPQSFTAKSSRPHHRRASGPRWRDRQTCPHSRQTGGPVEVSVHRLATAVGRG